MPVASHNHPMTRWVCSLARHKDKGSTISQLITGAALAALEGSSCSVAGL